MFRNDKPSDVHRNLWLLRYSRPLYNTLPISTIPSRNLRSSPQQHCAHLSRARSTSHLLAKTDLVRYGFESELLYYVYFSIFTVGVVSVPFRFY